MNVQTRSNMAAGHIENYYLRFKREFIYTTLEDLPGEEWFWSPSEIEEFDWLWNKDTSLVNIAEELERSEMSVFLLSLDRIAKGKIKPRKGWNIW